MGSFFKKYWKFIIGIVIVMTIGLVIWRRQAIIAAPKKSDSYKVKFADVKDALTLSGSIQAAQKVTLQFQTGGMLAWVGVKEGDRVKKYQALAGLDVRQTQKNLQKDLKTYLDTRWDFEQTRDNNKDGVVTDKIKRILEQSQFGLDKSVLDVEIQHLALELSTLTTPISGIVTRIDSPYSGVNITPASARFEVINPDTYYFNVVADQVDVVKLKEGMSVDIALDAYPEAKFTGRIERIADSPAGGESGTEYDMRVALTSPNSVTGQLRLGMTGDAVFILNEKKSVPAIPAKFIKSDSKGTYVLLATTKTKTYVQTGLEGETLTEIVKGLTIGDIVYD